MTDTSANESELSHLREQVHELEAEAERAEREVDQIAKIHQTLLPTQPPQIPGMSVWASHVAPQQAGGDYYDFIPMQRGADFEPAPGTKWLIIVADASGHGPAAAVIMAMLQAVIHAYSVTTDNPGEVLGFINQQMARKNIEGSFTTAVLAILDPEASTLAYASAGHHPPLLRTAAGEIRELSCDDGGPPLAVTPDSHIGSDVYSLAPGDTVLLYTDGTIEQADAQGNQFGLKRLEQTFAKAEGEPRDIVRTINRALRRHRDEVEQEDDKTLVALQRQP